MSLSIWNRPSISPEFANFIRDEELRIQNAIDTAARMMVEKANSWTGSYEFDEEDRIAWAEMLRKFGPTNIRKLLNRSLQLGLKEEAYKVCIRELNVLG